MTGYPVLLTGIEQVGVALDFDQGAKMSVPMPANERELYPPQILGAVRRRTFVILALSRHERSSTANNAVNRSRGSQAISQLGISSRGSVIAALPPTTPFISASRPLGH